MTNKTKLSTITAFFIGALLLVSILLVSLLSYSQFKKTLDERVLLQLTSIRELKKVQIENYLEAEWSTFLKVHDSSSFVTNQPDTLQYAAYLIDSGYVDISRLDPKNRVELLMSYQFDTGQYYLKTIHPTYIQVIVNERIGMGSSGETYLINEDFSLRSNSIFFPEKNPLDIICQSLASTQGLQGKEQTGIYPDYRDQAVYGSFKPLQVLGLNWVITSEIDKAEVSKPLVQLKIKLAITIGLVIVVSLILSSFIARSIANPIIRMKKQLSKLALGDSDLEIKGNLRIHELSEMFLSLSQLKASLNASILFSQEIGNMNFQADFQPLSNKDKLGQALLYMRDQLKEYSEIEKNIHINAQKNLLAGEERERQRISREIHDGIGPLLTSLKNHIQSLSFKENEKLELKTSIDDLIHEIRKISNNLMPSALKEFGVAKALLNFIEEVQKASSLKISYSYDPIGEGLVVSDELNIAIYRIIQELLNNTLKHSRASNVAISLTELHDRISLYYQDNGEGFDFETVKKGNGLYNIQQRVNIFDGYFEFTTDTKGVQVEIEFPIYHGNNKN